MKRSIKKLFNDPLGLKSILMLGLKVSREGFNLILSIIMTNFYSEETFGKFTSLLAFTNLLAVIVCLGFPNYIVRDYGVNKVNNTRILTNSLIVPSTSFLIVSVVTIGVYSFFGEEATYYFLPLTILFYFLNQIGSSVLLAEHQLIKSQVPELIIKPTLFTLLLLLIVAINEASTILDILLAYILCSAVAVLVLFLNTKRVIKDSQTTLFDIKLLDYKVVAQTLPFIVMSGLQILNAQVDIIYLTVLSDNNTVAYYKIAYNISMIFIVISNGLNLGISPIIAKHFREGKFSQIKNVYLKSQARVLILTIPALVIILLFGSSIIKTLWGDNFLVSYDIMIVLLVGVLFNSITGPLPAILNMTHNHRHALIGSIIIVVLNLALNPIFILKYGGIGAAYTNTISLILGNIYWLFFVRKIIFKASA